MKAQRNSGNLAEPTLTIFFGLSRNVM